MTNESGRPRRLSIVAYNEWMLGPPREGQHWHVVTERDDVTGAVLARNRYREEHADSVAFLWASEHADVRYGQPPIVRGPEWLVGGAPRR